MRAKLISDVELRARWNHRDPVYFVEEGTILTPAAKDFLREHNIQLSYTAPRSPSGSMTRTPIPTTCGGRARYVNALTGEEMAEKPEELTHLVRNQLVPKQHPRIAFRGGLDSLMAHFINVQWEADQEGYGTLVQDLEELLGFVRKILAAEVKDVPLESIRLLGMDSEAIRYTSHHVKESLGIDHPIPDYRMGRLCGLLNFLRTQVRETELLAIKAFEDETGHCRRRDIVEGLNRLSSCVYILFCRKLAGYYERENTI